MSDLTAMQVKVIIKLFCGRKGFEDWWENIDEEIQDEIKKELRAELDKLKGTS